MDRVSGRLTVFFEDPFWVGIFERTCSRLWIERMVYGRIRPWAGIDNLEVMALESQFVFLWESVWGQGLVYYGNRV
ncbi:MAG: YjdF family protein [Eubacterium sp.]|nr:YjdF family protein [Eubacterium sp.]